VALTDVFISYSREDRERVQRIAETLEGAGHKVWWDPHIKTGSGFREEIQKALSETKAVIVIWSENSVTSRFVCDEADEGAARDILFPALVDLVDIPLGFRQIQTADLTSWRGHSNDRKFREYIRVVSDHIDTQRSGGSSPQLADAALAPAPQESRPALRPAPAGPKTQTKRAGARGTFVTGRGLRLALLWRSIALTLLIAGAFGALAYGSDFLYAAYRPAFVAIMAGLVFVSRFGTFEADRARGAASLRLFSRSYAALLLFSLIAISPLILEGRLYTEALKAVRIHGINGADINGVDFSSSGKQLVTASDDKTARVWDTATGVQRLVLSGHTGWVWQGSFSPDGNSIVTASRDMTARIWDARSGASRRTLSGHLASVLDARYLTSGNEIATASADKTVRIWNAETGEVVRTFEGHSARVNGLAVSVDGRLIASVDGAGGVRVWRPATGEVYASFEVPGENWQDVVFDRGGRRIAAAGEDGQAFVWDVVDRRWIATINHGSKLFAVAFISSGELATGGIDSVVRIWRIATGEMEREITGHRDSVRELNLPADGDALASGIRDLSLSPDGKSLATASRDNTARIWNLATGAEIQIVGHTNPALRLPIALDVPPVLFASHAPTSANLIGDPMRAGNLLVRGLSLAAVVLLIGLLLKGIMMLFRSRGGAQWAVVTTLGAASIYIFALTLSGLPIEASYLWLIFGFVPAALLSVFLWLVLSMLAGARRPSHQRPAGH
jgi:WD40 repeat protein